MTGGIGNDQQPKKKFILTSYMRPKKCVSKWRTEETATGIIDSPMPDTTPNPARHSFAGTPSSEQTPPPAPHSSGVPHNSVHDRHFYIDQRVIHFIHPSKRHIRLFDEPYVSWKHVPNVV